MQYWGKVAGAALGFFAGGVVGAVLGAFIGHQFDKALGKELGGSGRGWKGTAGAADEDVFFATTFRVMGHVAKADGRVSEGEIAAARAVMQEMRLSPERVKAAIARFTEGKRPDFPLDHTVSRFRSAYFPRTDLYRTFMEIQVQAAVADGQIHPSERDVLWRVARKLGISRVELAQIEALARARQWGGRPGKAVTGDRLGEAYKALGVRSSDDDAAVKKAYRRLMNQHHPDKLVARGLPEDMMDVARERTREIRAAYEVVKEARGMR